jgi:hypothetical protein
MKLTVEFSATELQKMLRAIAGSQEHEKFQPYGSESIIMPLSSDRVKKMWNTLSTLCFLGPDGFTCLSDQHKSDHFVTKSDNLKKQ